ncbi:MAG: GNAT family N-acetyltransferase [Caulobacteraceae bacterium]
MSGIVIRPAVADDLPAIVAMLADDPLGADREDASAPMHPRYQQAFAAISADFNQHLVVADFDGEVIGTLQLSVIPGLSRRGASKGLIQAVRVRSDRRNYGLGARLIAWAVEVSRRQGCATVELTTHESRGRAHSFYVRLGFKPTHVGFKLEF